MPRDLAEKPFAFAWRYSKPHWYWVFLACLAVFCASSFQRVQFYLIGKMTDAASQIDMHAGLGFDTLWYWVIVYCAAYFFTAVSWRSSGFSGMRWITKTSALIHKDLFGYLTGQSTAYFRDRFAGALSNKISNAAHGVEALVAKTLWDFLPLTFGFFANIVVTLLAHYYITLVFVAWMILVVWFNVFWVRRLYKYSLDHAKARSTLRGKIVDSTTNIDAVHLLGRRSFERDYVEKFIDFQRVAHLRAWIAGEWLLVANGFLLLFFTASMLGVSVYLLQVGLISVGNLIMIISLVVVLQRTLFFIGARMAEAMSDYGQIKEGLMELLLPHEIVDVQGAKTLSISHGEIQFRHVGFSYAETRVFEEFNLQIPAGQKLGVVGVSGAGKSTMVSLLLRQYEVNEGEILIDSQNINDVAQETLRHQVALVPQSTSLFHRTIRENILYGRLDASEDEVKEAARLARADEFISVLPKGYDTQVGERGVKLSGGQRQRIAIARAILKNASILVLDEATSSLDSESEEAIQEALSILIRNKTVIAVAHRLSTLRAMDRIVVLDKGKIAEDGSHNVLLDRDGIYARLWNSQVSGFIQES